MDGEGLKQYRRAHGLRQRDLEPLLGVDQPTISEMERGLRPIPEEIAAKLDAGAGPPVVPPSGEEATEGGGAQANDDRIPSGDVPPRPRRPERPVVLPVETNLAELEVRLLKLIQGEDVAIAVADPGETEIRHVAQHIPGLADVVGAVNEFDGLVIRNNAVAMSKAWVKLAREKPRVRMVLESLTAGGAWRDVFAATAPVILAILLNHGLLPSLPGLVVGPAAPEYDANGDGSGAGAPGYFTSAEGALG